MIFNDPDGVRGELDREERDVIPQDVVDLLFQIIVRDLRMEAK